MLAVPPRDVDLGGGLMIKVEGTATDLALLFLTIDAIVPVGDVGENEI